MSSSDQSFIAGYLTAMQFIAISHGQEQIAGEGLYESGFSEKEFLKEQRKSGYETKKMNKIIKNGFKKYNDPTISR